MGHDTVRAIRYEEGLSFYLADITNAQVSSSGKHIKSLQ